MNQAPVHPAPDTTAAPGCGSPEVPGASTRRSFFGVLIGSISAVVGALMAVPLARFALDPVLHPAGGADWFDLGSPDQYGGAAPVRAEVAFRKVDGWRVSQVRQTVCPHLGCVALWNGERQRFVCPCHQGNFAADGSRISGPPPRGLDPLPVKVAGGKLWVKYQYFRGLVPTREVIG